MRDLNPNIGIHRIVTGVGKTNPSTHHDRGKFVIPVPSGWFNQKRKACCKVYVGLGHSMLSMTLWSYTKKRTWSRGVPSNHEINQLRTLFFFPEENPIMRFPPLTYKQSKDVGIVQLWLRPSDARFEDPYPIPGEDYQLFLQP